MVKTELWVKAHLALCFSKGLTAVIANKGAPEAGAVYVQITMSNTQVKVLAPAPGPAFDDMGNRTWSQPLGADSVTPQQAQEYFNRQRSFDRDIWILDIDDRQGMGLLMLPQ